MPQTADANQLEALLNFPNIGLMLASDLRLRFPTFPSNAPGIICLVFASDTRKLK